jgi:hypothetical protein
MESCLVATDIGFGNAKGVGAGQSVVTPSVVAVPVGDLGLAGLGMKTVRQATRIAFDRGDFYVGPEARSWGRVVENMDFSRLASPETEALFYAVLTGLVPDGASVRLVIGLPVPLLRDEAVARPLLETLRSRLVRTHAVRVNGQPFGFTVTGVRAAAQPMGAWADWALDGEGRWAHPAGRTALVAVLDIGFNTLDLYGVRGGRLEPRLVGGEKVGVRRLLDLSAPGMAYHEANEQLRAGKVSAEGLAVWFSELVGTAERVWNGTRPDLLLLVGGGAVLLRERVEALRRAFQVEVIVPEDPVLANARGLWKWGQTVRW